MKKIISLVLVVAMVLSLSVVAFAAKLGDVNGDGQVTGADALYVLQATAGMKTLTAEQKKKADYNKDGNVSAIDARMILQCVVGLLPEEELTTSTPPSVGDDDGDDSISWDDIINAGKK